MSLAAKRRLVMVALILLAIWPGAHYAIVQATDMSPWKGFGWAMYTRPSFPGTTRLTALDQESGQLATLNLRDLGPLSAREFTRFHARWRRLGRLADPTAAARRLLVERPTTRSLTVASTTQQLDERGYVEDRTDRWLCERAGPTSAVCRSF